MKAFTILLFASAAAFAGNAFAQQAPPAAAPAQPVDTNSTTTVATVVVTANKRVENIQNVPTAVTAVSPEKLSSLNVSSTTDLVGIVPSLSYSASPSPNFSQFIIRGVGTFAFADSLESAVGVAVDGVPLARMVGSISDSVDTQRVEVLRGPQGELFGKNATAGVINLVTNPVNLSSFSADGRAYYGSHNEGRIEATTNIPIIDGRLAIRASVWDFTHDGYIYDPTLGQKLGSEDDHGARLKIAAKPTDFWRLDFTVEDSRNSSNGPAVTDRSYLVTDPAAFKAANVAQNIVAGPNNTTVGSDFPAPQVVTTDAFTLQSVWDFRGATLTSLSSYRGNSSRLLTDTDYTDSQNGAPSAEQTYISRQHQVTSELRLQSNDDKNPLQYTVGLFVYDFTINSLYQGVTNRDPGAASASDRFIHLNTLNYAAFGQVTYDIGKLRLIAGGRVSRDETDGTFVRELIPGYDPALYPGTFTLTGTIPLSSGLRSVAATEPSYKFGAEYHFTSDLMLYATASRGYIGPGLNYSPTVAAAQFNVNNGTVAPEIAYSYEVGVRSQLWERQLTLNLTGYYSPFDNFQTTALTATIPPTQAIINAKQLLAEGVELEFAARPRFVEGLSLDGNVSYNNTHYSNFTNAPCYSGQAVAAAPTSAPGICAPTSVGSSATQQSVNGMRAIGAPEWAANLFFTYDRSLRENLHGFLQGHYSYSGAIQWAVGDNPATESPSYDTLDLTVGLHDNADRWRLSFIARNVFSNLYVDRIAVNSPGMVQVYPYEAFPSVGVALSVHY